MTRAKSVIVIGAGAAGLLCARDLRRAGLRVRLIDARDRTGGRAFTAPDANGAELGAEFIHGEAPLTHRLLREYGLAAYDLPENFEVFRDGKRQALDRYWEGLTAVFRGIRERKNDRSFADYLATADFSSDQKAAARAFVGGFHAAFPEDISANALHAAEAQVSDPDERKMARILGGYVKLTESLTREVRSTLCLSHEAHELHWESGGVVVRGQRLDQGTGPRKFSLRADAAVITLPIPLWNPLTPNDASLRFHPILPPARLHALNGIRPGLVVRIGLEFESEFFARKFPQPLSFITAPDLPFMTWWSARPFSWPRVTAWAGGHHAQELSRLSSEERTAQALRDFSQVTRVPVAELKAALKSVFHHDWERDPHSRMAYSYLGVGHEKAPAILRRSLQRTLYFAGEALSEEHSGTVEGALQTGASVARALLRDLRE